ncbi:kinase-like domain-containing protein [Mycena olivaceomarginata]|nr:kinase-like domain-containing protein [Mycena olivaceomarginata]
MGSHYCWPGVEMWSRYETLAEIGHGAFGIVKKVRRKADNKLFACKEINFVGMDKSERKQIIDEVNILRNRQHDHIVSYVEKHVNEEAGILYIIMEYCRGGDLSALIKSTARNQASVSENEIWAYFTQILLALDHCHSNGRIIHRDLKPDNVFLDSEKRIKLGDFGVAKALGGVEFCKTFAGTPQYMSPEMIKGYAYDSKTDIWSLGCMVYELCALKPAFSGAKTLDELSAMMIRQVPYKDSFQPRRLMFSGYSGELRHVIKSMLQINPAMRPSASELLTYGRVQLEREVLENKKLHVVSAKRTQQMEAQICRLQSQIHECQSDLYDARNSCSNAIQEAVRNREEELSAVVLRREEGVIQAILMKEKEMMDAARQEWGKMHEAHRELEDRERMLQLRDDDLQRRKIALEEISEAQMLKANVIRGQKTNAPNGVATNPDRPSPIQTFPMEGVILTKTGEEVETPSAERNRVPEPLITRQGALNPGARRAAPVRGAKGAAGGHEGNNQEFRSAPADPERTPTKPPVKRDKIDNKKAADCAEDQEIENCPVIFDVEQFRNPKAFETFSSPISIFS